MKKILLFLLAFSMFASTYGQFNPNSGAVECSKRKSQWQSLPSLKSSEAFIPHSFDVLKYTLDIDLFKNHLSPYPNDFTANITVKFKVDSVLNSITLNAGNPSLQINAVSLAGQSFTHANDLLTITLDRTYNPGEIVEVGIKYKHLNIDDFGFYANGGFVFTDSEPEGARRWMPCYDKPSDKAKW
jgi:aminopeptidase N